MILSVGFQAEVFAVSFICGMAMGVFYDVLRLFRIYKRHSLIEISAEDILYWAVCTLVFYNVMLDINYGEIRFFVIFSFFFGLITYHYTVGKLVMSAAKGIIDFLVKAVKLLVEIIFTPFKLLWILIRRPVKFLCNLLSKVLISKQKCVKILYNTDKKVKNKFTEAKKGKGNQCQKEKRRKKKNHFQVF